MLDKELLRSLAPKKLGEQLHTNHVGCEAGTDIKKRLYIKRVVGGIVGYCHHCGDKGFVAESSDDGDLLRDWLYGKVDDMPRITRQPYHYVPLEMSATSKAWLHKYHVQACPEIFQVKDGVLLQLRNLEGEICGYQIRTKSGKPKYLTALYDNADSGVAWFLHYPFSKDLFITEDYLSAYRINKDAKQSSLALLKTTMSDQTLKMINDLAVQRIYV